MCIRDSDTIYAEGQRRYIETFNAYARQFLGGLERPDVDKIEGLSPVIAIEQKTTSKNPRSTVGTITEIYDYLRLLYARVATPFSSETNEPMVAYTEDQIIDLVRQEYHERKIALMTPLVKYRKGHYRELFVLLAKKGFDKVRVDGEIRDIEPGMMLDRYKAHDVELIIDRLILKDSITDERLRSSILQAFQQGDGVMMVYDYESGGTKFFSKNLMCPTTGLSYDLPEPNTFSFNSPKGACTTCAGLGELKEPNFDLIFDDPKKSLKDNLAPVFEVLKNTTRLKTQLEGIFVKHNVDEKNPYGKLPQAFLDDLKNLSLIHI